MVIILIVWLLLGMFILVQNSDLIATTENKKDKIIGMVVFILSAPFYIIIEIFDYILGEIFDDKFKPS